MTIFTTTLLVLSDSCELADSFLVGIQLNVEICEVVFVICKQMVWFNLVVLSLLPG